MKSRKRILLVEDDPDIRAMIAGFLPPIDYEIVEAGDVSVANKELTNGQTFDLAILDFWLGNDHAVSIMDTIASEGHMPVIMISGGNKQMDLEKTQAISDVSGAVVFLQKPFRKADLIEAVTSALSSHLN